MRFMMIPLRRQQQVAENMEDLILPDMSALADVDNETSAEKFLSRKLGSFEDKHKETTIETELIFIGKEEALL